MIRQRGRSLLRRVGRVLFRALFDRPERYLGFRGMALVLFALTYFGMGFGILFQPVAPELYYGRIPVEFRLVLWHGSGLLALFAAVYKRPRWQERGFAALLLPMGERFTAYGGALLFDNETLRWLPGVAIYGLCCALIALIAAWPEPAPLPTLTRHDDSPSD